MKTSLDQKISKLIKNRLMLNNEQIGLFEEAMESIFDLHDINRIHQLCLGFDDKTEQQDVMFGLIHGIEAYDGEYGMAATTQTFISAAPKLIPHAVNWLEIILMRYLNNDAARNVLKEELKKAGDESQEVISKALKQIQEKDPEAFYSLVKEVIE
jgi:hypothetical protein